ncbi:MAG: hypothetical protein ACRDDY_03055, partial [Clostridium sp.]|uniref:hypothetical protein n=1 Tax=Clostridium sp. TaxID=1506 RepID=UPI003EE7103F
NNTLIVKLFDSPRGNPLIVKVFYTQRSQAPTSLIVKQFDCQRNRRLAPKHSIFERSIFARAIYKNMW